MDSRLSIGKRLLTGIKAGLHYATWYPGQYLPSPFAIPRELNRSSRAALRYVERTSRRLARTLFHSMARHGPALEKRQLLLGRLVDAAGELFALSSAHLRADAILRGEKADDMIGRDELPALLAYLTERTKCRVNRLFGELGKNADKKARKLSRAVLGYTS